MGKKKEEKIRFRIKYVMDNAQYLYNPNDIHDISRISVEFEKYLLLSKKDKNILATKEAEVYHYFVKDPLHPLVNN